MGFIKIKNASISKDSNKNVKRGGEGLGREFVINTHTLLYLKWKTSKDLLYNTGNSAQCFVAAWMGEELGREWIYVYAWLSSFAVCYHNTVNWPYANKK